ncbi:6490_t:CDS:2 [Ambispora leptoticha]|uniref:6490_t:CDS:1 n=1 Tax=Ambispora leptoticha TaxID=144679 RepID=A0A9N8V3B1_9GLOM|nr:6490_t:CDS:2 [Ambispora leptoticha]
MAPTQLKIKGNRAFSMLSSIENEADLSKTWRLMTKVKDALEYGKRLENLSWRLWFMHHQMVHDPKTQSKFRRLSSLTTKKLDTEKSTHLSKLAAPIYRPRQEGHHDNSRRGRNRRNNHGGAGGNGSNGNHSNNKRPQGISTSGKKAGANSQKNTLKDKSGISTGNNIATKVEPTTAIASVEDMSRDLNSEGQQQSMNNYSIVSKDNDEDEVMIDNTTMSNDLTVSDSNSLNDSYAFDINVMDVENMTSDNVIDENISPLTRASDSLDEENNDITASYTSDQESDSVLRLPDLERDTVLRLPGQFVGFDTYVYLNPARNAPTMELDMSTMHNRFPEFSSSESSEPTSPTGEFEFYNNSMLSVTAADGGIGQQSSSGIQSNLTYQIGEQLVGTSSSGIHSAVYVPRNHNHSPTTDINSSLMTALNSGLSSSNVNNLSANNLMGGSQTVNSSNSPNRQTTTATSTSSSTTSSATTSENRPKKTHSSGDQQCFNCGVTSTPLWRRSANDELLCNACGLYLKLHKMARPKTMKPHIVRKDAREDESTQPVCSNCGTMTTPLWRRDEEGQTLCNACGLYFKLHHEKRPLSMKTDVIKKRQRYENGQNPNRRSSKKQRSIDDSPQQESQQLPSPSQQSTHQSQGVYGPISVSPTTTTMTIPPPQTSTNSNSIGSTSTLSMNVPNNLVDQEHHHISVSSISMPSSSSMTAATSNRSLHGSFP